VIRLAQANFHHLGTFIRLIDYMVVETQVRINQEAAELIVHEMDREDRKYPSRPSLVSIVTLMKV